MQIDPRTLLHKRKNTPDGVFFVSLAQIGRYRTERAYSEGVMPNFSLNCREK